MRASYARAIDWIANEDEPLAMTVEEVEWLMTVCLVADVWGKSRVRVAGDVIARRWQLKQLGRL
jgi:hypothetical protein